MVIKASPVTGFSPSSSSSMSSTSCDRVIFSQNTLLRSSFLNGGALKISQLPSPKRLRYNEYGNIQMNLFDSYTRVVKSFANALISTFEDPEKLLEQAVLETSDDLKKIHRATAQVLASQKLLENKYKAASRASDDWYKRAKLALGKGEEDLAREALKRRKTYADSASSLKSQFDQQKTVVDNLVSITQLLESKIQKARSKKDILKARAQTAKNAAKVNEMLGNVYTSALSAFVKMEEKVLAMESESEALSQLTTDDLEGKFAMLESTSVDDDLASLKRELSANSNKGELPPGRTAVNTNTGFHSQDTENERDLNELRRKAKE